MTTTDHTHPEFLVAAAERVGAAYPDLFPHQRSGVAFLLSRRRAILADDMGLGKTRTAIVAAREQAPDGPYLVVCPASLKLNWAREIHLVEPTAHVDVLDGNPIDDTARWTVVNYDRLRTYVDELAERQFAVVVVDEAHYIKNRSQRAARVMRILDTRPEGVYLLTGTPMTNRPRDLFQQLKAISHPLGRSFYSYARRYCGAFDNGYGLDSTGASNLDELSEMIAPVMLRRAKSEVLDLPPKVRTWLPVDVPLTRVKTAERRALDFLADNPEREGPSWITFLGMLNKARHELALVKARATTDLVSDLVEAGQKVVVFTAYTGVVDTLTEAFGDRAVRLTGDTPATERQRVVDRFQRDDAVRVFVGNIHAAGVGITLTRGTHVVFNDLDWVPANHWQAEDRIHRIGQTSTAFVTYVFAPDSLDGFVAALLETKAAMVAEVEEQSAHHSSLIDTVVSLAIDGGTTPVGVTEPARPTMGLLEETLSLLEQFRTTAPELAALDNGVREYRFASSSSPGTYYDVMVVNGVPDCTCPGFAYGSMCWHAKAALRGDTSKAVVSA